MDDWEWHGARKLRTQLDGAVMEFFTHLRDAFDGYPQFAFCTECDEEITPDDPCYIDFDGDVDDDGRPVDCSTYLCASCGVLKGIR